MSTTTIVLSSLQNGEVQQPLKADNINTRPIIYTCTLYDSAGVGRAILDVVTLTTVAIVYK